MALDFRAVFDSLQSPYMVLDREFCYVAANPAYQKVIMRPLEALLGRNLFDLFPNEGESGRRLKESFEIVRDTGEPHTLAYIPYDIPRPESQGGGFEERFWTAVHTPVHDDAGRTEFIVQNTVDVTELVRLREASSLPFRFNSGETALLQRTREVEEAQRKLLAESADFRRFFQQAQIFLAVLSGPEHIFTFVNDAYARLIGKREVLGLRAADALPEVRPQGFIGLLDEVYRTGESRSGEGVQVLLRGDDPGTLREAYLDFSYDPIFDTNGRISGILVQGMDRTESVRAQERQTLLMHELNHRVKNTLATVQALTTSTLRTQRDPAAAAQIVEKRINALAQAHDLVSRENWSGASLREVITAELRAYGDERVDLSGAEINLPPRSVLAISLVLHELATNAAKYGAFSGDRGVVTVSWSLTSAEDGGPPRLRLEWRERGGPPPPDNRKKGFGSRLIQMTINGELSGEYNQQFEPQGFQADFTIPLSSGTNVYRTE